MPQERLLERIRILDRNPDRRISRNVHSVIQSVQLYMLRILNTNQGSAPISDDFGMPDITGLPASLSGDKIQELLLSIKRMLQKYEPRIRNIRINFLPSEEGELLLKYQLSCELADTDERVPVVFEIDMTPDGKINVLA